MVRERWIQTLLQRRCRLTEGLSFHFVPFFILIHDIQFKLTQQRESRHHYDSGTFMFMYCFWIQSEQWICFRPYFYFSPLRETIKDLKGLRNLKDKT